MLNLIVIGSVCVFCYFKSGNFPNNWELYYYYYSSQNVSKFSIQDCKLPPKQDSVVQLKPGDDCEVLTEGKDDDPSGWWPATVKMMKGEFYVVDYKIQDETKYSDIIPSDKIRSPNRR